MKGYKLLIAKIWSFVLKTISLIVACLLYVQLAVLGFQTHCNLVAYLVLLFQGLEMQRAFQLFLTDVPRARRVIRRALDSLIPKLMLPSTISFVEKFSQLKDE